MITQEEFVLEAEILRAEVQKLTGLDQRCINGALAEFRHILELYGHHGTTALALLSAEVLEKGGMK